MIFKVLNEIEEFLDNPLRFWLCVLTIIIVVLPN